jgi:hypothetical protein
MMSEIHDCIGAFADGEPVDPEVLDRALAAPDGRAYLIDLLALRRLFGRHAPLAAPAPASAASTPARPTVTRRFLAAAAAVVVAGTLGGYAAGRMSIPAAVPVRQAASLQQPPGAALTAPAPTQVIRLEPGVDWNERGGGD